MAPSNSSVDSALGVLRLMEDKMGLNSPAFLLLKVDYRFLRTFLRCARKWSNIDVRCRKSCDNEEVSLASFLLIVEDTVLENVEVMMSLCLGSDDGMTPHSHFKQLLSEFHERIESFAEEIDGFYAALIEFCLSKFVAPIKDELVGFLDSLLDNIRDVRTYDMKEVAEVLEENVKFLKNIICFAAMRGVEDRQLEDLMRHTEVMAMNVAHLYYSYAYVGVAEMNFKLSELLQKIKPVESQVRETYTRVLRISTFSGSSNRVNLKIDEHILREFIGSVRANLWDILTSGPRFAESVKDQMPLLYEGLSFLKDILRDQQKMFEELHEQSRNLIGDMVSEAGIIICSLFANQMEEDYEKDINLALSNVMKKIKSIKSEVVVKYPVTTRFKFHRTDDLALVDSLLESLDKLLSNEAQSMVSTKDQLREVQENLIFIRAFMENIVEFLSEHDEIQAIRLEVMDVVNKVEFLIDSLVIRDHLICCPMLLDSNVEETKNLKTKALEIQGNEKYVKKKSTSTRASSYVQSQVSIPIISDIVVGFDDEAEIMIDKLTRGTSELDVVSIVGMPGLGKTTLAKKVYDDSQVIYRFHVRSWSCVSQQYHKRKLLLEILKNVSVKSPDRFAEMDEDDLYEQLYKSLKGQRYLIVLDDVWDVAVWNDFGRIFPNDLNGSRILLTSRIQNVAAHANSEPHFLGPLTDDQSCELLQKKLYHVEDFHDPGPCEVVSEIAKICKGLPLSIVVAAGILANLEQNLWAEVVESLRKDMLYGTDQQCMSTIELSYNHLPDYLKPCLLYFGVFPEDEEVPVCKVMWLWIAEGFVPKSDSKSLEDIAQGYMMDLQGRSLVMVAQKSSRGVVKACRIHDLLHEFCMAKAKEENFVRLLRGPDELSTFYEPRGLRRLCIHSEQEHLRRSRLFSPHIRSLLVFNTDKSWHARDPCDISFIIRFSKVLRVLNLGKINLGDSFPCEIELLVQLRYLAICGDMYFIPSSSISKLWNLEALFIEGFSDDILLPDDIWDMKKLRHLHISKGAALSLPVENLENPGLHNLATFSTASVCTGPETEKIMRMFPNIGRLKMKLLESRDCDGVLALDFLHRLESLRLSSTFQIPDNFEFLWPQNLKKLTLSEFMLPWTEISAIGRLPNLMVLKLLSGAFHGETWDMEEEGLFPELRFLKMEFLNIVSWTESCENFFCCLEKLVFRNCWNLEEVPFILGEIPTLQMIEVYRCTHSLANVVMQIQEEQESLGNEDLKVLIHATDWTDEA